MSSKILKDAKIWDVNGFPIHVEIYDSELIVKDEDGNIMRISKKNRLSIILKVNGIFKSG